MPDLSPDEFERRFEQALEARVAGNPHEAVRRLEALLARGERVATLAGTIGTILLAELDAPDRAIPYLERTVGLSPRSRLASLNLCRALIATKQMKRASAEARRFLDLQDSEEHRLLLETSEAAGDGKPRLVVVLLVETSRLPEPYAALHAGLAEVKNRLRANGVLHRLDLYLVTFAGRVWSLTRLHDIADDPNRKNLGAAGRSAVDLKRNGLVWGLLHGVKAAHAALADLRSRGIPHLRPWLVMLTGGALDGERKRLLARCERIVQPLRNDPGLNVFPVLTGPGGADAAIFEFAGASPLRLREDSVDAFFAWLAENLERALRADAPGAKIRLTMPRWAAAA
jgi:hypothetical protein